MKTIKTLPRKYLALGGLIVVAAIVGVLELTNTTYLLHDRKAISGAIPAQITKSAADSSTKSGTKTPSSDTAKVNTNEKSASTGAQTTTPVVTGQPPDAPFGSLVSNHKPNLGGSPAPSSELSTCSTTPGAVCTMQFTNTEGVVKTLNSQTADSNGNVSWSWDVNKAEFTKGTWKIKAIATLNGQSRSTTDTIDLEVQE